MVLLFHCLRHHFPKQARRKSHHIVERAFDGLDAHAANPLLHAVGASLVVRFIMLHVIEDLLVGEFGEVHGCGAIIGEHLLRGGHGETAEHGV